jgi:hypothetical protein
MGMQIADAPCSLRRYLEQRSLVLERTAPATLLAAIVDWYQSVRAQDATPLEEDGDMLLLQWGTYDWGEGPTFQYNLTRQLVAATDDVDDQEIWQLGLTAHFNATEELAQLGSANQWCGSPSECYELRREIRTSPATQQTATERPMRVEITFGRV